MQLYMASDQEAEQVNCTIDLFDSQGVVTDTAILGFGVNATVREPLPDPFPPPAIRTVENFTPPKVATCIDKCGMFNAVCLWWKGCTAEIAKLFGGIAGALIGRVHPSQTLACLRSVTGIRVCKRVLCIKKVAAQPLTSFLEPTQRLLKMFVLHAGLQRLLPARSLLLHIQPRGSCLVQFACCPI